jgi:hypothetical protein
VHPVWLAIHRNVHRNARARSQRWTELAERPARWPYYLTERRPGKKLEKVY